MFRGPLAPTGWAEPLPKAEAKLLVDKKELFIKLRLMKRGLGARGPTWQQAARVYCFAEVEKRSFSSSLKASPDGLGA